MRKKKILYTAAIVLAAIVTTSVNVTETKAGVFGKYGKLVVEMEGAGATVYDCNYSLKSDCRRSDW